MQTGSPADSGPPSPPSDGTPVEYLWKLEESLRYWYSAAETKAQVVVTLNGVFLAFVTGSILTNSDKAALTLTVFGPETWMFLAGMAAGSPGPSSAPWPASCRGGASGPARDPSTQTPTGPSGPLPARGHRLLRRSGHTGT